MSENVEIQDESPIKYYTTIPFIIQELGLHATQISIYLAIKRSSGDFGHCTKSKENLAKHAGISESTLNRYLPTLSHKFDFIKKPLITIQKRKTEHGDDDTDLITIINIWPENFAYFNCEKRGGVNLTPPDVKLIPGGVTLKPGVVSARHQGGVSLTPKETTIKKQSFKKTTTTPTPNVHNQVNITLTTRRSSSSSFSNKLTFDQEQAAKSLKDYLDKQANRTRSTKNFGNREWGKDWIIPIHVFENLIHTYTLPFFEAQLNYMVRQQELFDRGKIKKGIEIPENFLKRACKENYANFSIHDA